MPSVTYIPPGLTTSALNMASGGTNNYVMTAVDGDTIQGEASLQFDGSTLTVGANTDGYDVKFFGDTTAKYMLWDESEDNLIVIGNVGIGLTDPERTPAAILEVSGNTNKLGVIQVTQRVSGAAAYGLDIGLDSTTGDPIFSRIVNDTVTEAFRIERSTGNIFINESLNGNMTTGLTINMGAANDEGFVIKNSDVGHAMTAVQEADTFFSIRKSEGGSGGALINGYKDGDDAAGFAILMRGNLGVAADTTESTSSIAVVQMDAKITDASAPGTGTKAVHADGNIFIVSNALTPEFMVKGDGELFANNATVATFDAYDDAQLIRALDHARQSPTMIRERWDDFVKYNEQDLVEAGILGDTRENGGMLNVTGLQRLHNGAIWQGYVRQQEMQEKIDTLESRLLAIEGAK